MRLWVVAALVFGSSSASAQTWFATTWSPCDTPCGAGERTRLVRCVDAQQQVLATTECADAGVAPAEREACTAPAACPAANWEVTQWSACSTTCGPGERQRSARCVATTTGETLPAQACLSSAPAITSSCNDGACPAGSWFTTAFGACNAPCGPGSQARDVWCVDVAQVPLPVTACPAPAPETSRACQTGACVTPQWVTGDYGACDARCGPGTMSRAVHCVANGVVVDSAQCPTPAPTSTASCNSGACPAATWVAGDFGACSSVCSGTRSRVIRCVDAQGNVLPDAACSTPRPPTEAVCSGPCPPGVWEHRVQIPCTAACGAGVEIWEPVCVDPSTRAVLRWDQCLDPAFARTEIRSCERPACPADAGTWVTAPEAPCSAACGGGRQRMTLRCVFDLNEWGPQSCPAQPPPSERSCNTQACLTGTWTVVDAGACNASCGNGIAIRQVECRGDAGVLPSSACGDPEPAQVISCAAAPCPPAPTWVTGSWSACSAPCGLGERTRAVSCRDGALEVAESLCSGPRPADRQICNQQSCPAGTWLTGSFGACSASCGGGQQTRTVRCVDGVGAPLPEGACAGAPPTSARLCNEQTCPPGRWVTGSFGACSVACDLGVQTRAVQCVDQTTGAPLPELACTDPRPVDFAACNPQPCVAWQLGAYGACSVACGGGVATRDVHCVDSAGRPLADTACPAPKPSNSMACNEFSCPMSGTWRTGDFGACSVACGGGLATRDVQCVDGSGGALPDTACPAPKPSNSMACNETACPMSGTWQPGEYGDCSATCGAGTRQRTVTCVDGAGAVIGASACTAAPPPTAESCQRACAWVTSDWSACSCEGQRERSVGCVRDGQSTDDAVCAALGPAPEHLEACESPCPTQSCSATGGGLWLLALVLLGRRRTTASLRP